MALYKVNSGDFPLASDVDQIVDIFSGVHDIGAITFAPVVSAPSIAGVTAAAVAGTALGVGAYRYALTYKTGYKKTNGTFVYTGETVASTEITVTTTSTNQAVNLAALPTAWPVSVISMTIYRTAVGGAAGTTKLLAIVTTPSATYADMVADASLGVAVPTVNTTGTSLPVGNVSGVLPVANGGTGSATQTIVDLTTAQTIGGAKTFSGNTIIGSTGTATTKNNTLDDGTGVSYWYGTMYARSITQTANSSSNIVYFEGRDAGNVPRYSSIQGNSIGTLFLNPSGTKVVLTGNNTLDDGAGNAILGPAVTVKSTSVVSFNFDAGRAAVSKIWWNASPTTEDGLHFNVDGVADLLKIAKSGAVTTKNNTIDDGAGAMTIAGPLTINGAGGSFANSKAANGYQKLPGGLIIQWGQSVGAPGTSIGFPVAFPTACVSVTTNNIGNNYWSSPSVYSLTTTNFSSYSTQNINISWIAIGY